MEAWSGWRCDDLHSLGRELLAEDIRWQQRFSNYCKALERLEDFLEPPVLNEREQQGLIKAFEYIYNPVTADAIAAKIIGCYLPCFQQLRSRLKQRVQEEAP